MIKITTAAEAWEVAYKIADAGEYELDKDSEERAGYPIYRAKESYYSRFCDLTDRLEVIKADGTSTNVLIKPGDATTEGPAHYGDELATKIRESTKDAPHTQERGPDRLCSPAVFSPGKAGGTPGGQNIPGRFPVDHRRQRLRVYGRRRDGAILSPARGKANDGLLLPPV